MPPVHSLTIAHPGSSSPPSIISRDDDCTLSIAFNGIREGLREVTIYSDCVPTGKHLASIKARRAELVAALAPADPTVIRTELSKLFTMPHQGGGSIDPRLMTRVFLEDLGDLPEWAIVRTCLAFRRGEAGEGHWAPSQAEIRRYAKLLTRRFDGELLRIDKVLNARVIEPPRLALR